MRQLWPNCGLNSSKYTKTQKLLVYLEVSGRSLVNVVFAFVKL